MYLYACVNTVCRAPARATRVSYTVLTLTSVKFCVHFPRSQWFQSPKAHHFVHEASDSTSKSVRFLARFRPSLLHSHPLLDLSISLPSILLFFLSIPSFLATYTFYLLFRCPESTDYIPRAKRTPVLITAETPELLQRRRSLVSAGWRLHGHRGWLHGPEGGPRQTVVVHITRCPRSADPYSRPVHRRRATWHLTLKS